MINLWARGGVEDEDEARESENPLSQTASPEPKRSVAAKSPGEEPLLECRSSHEITSSAYPDARATTPQPVAKVTTPFKLRSETHSEEKSTPSSPEVVQVTASFKTAEISEIALPEDPVTPQPPRFKLPAQLAIHLPDTCNSRLADPRLADPIAECRRRIAVFESEIEKRELALEKTKQHLARNEQEMASHGDSDALEDLDMELQLSALEQVREIADVCEAMRACKISLYKLMYDADAFPNIRDAVPPERFLSKKSGAGGYEKPTGFVRHAEQRAAMRDLATVPSSTW